MHVHLDLVGGLAGDMFLGAAIDAGLCSPSEIEEVLSGLGLGNVRVIAEPVVRGALAATQVTFADWDSAAEADHRHLSSILDRLDRADLPASVRGRATQMFRELGEAEAEIHDVPVDRVHFHECGGLDSIFDFVGAAWVIEELADSWSAGTAPVGTGTIETDHGTMPVPAPATARLLEGQAVEHTDVEAERITPTGATIVRTVAHESSDATRPRGTVETSGFGAGSRDLDAVANVVRLLAFRRADGAEIGPGAPGRTERICRLTTDVDDMQPEHAAAAAETLRELGALDVVREPLSMKKGREGLRFTVLGRSDRQEELLEALFRHTTTFGVRTEHLERRVLDRTVETVETEYGDVDVKIGYWGDRRLQCSAEYDDCRELAAATDTPIADVYRAAERAAHEETSQTERANGRRTTPPPTEPSDETGGETG
ncbi:MAG: nickel pincer cofactor biosynthesis protein LarC [Bradymonadaceae bacterium]